MARAPGQNDSELKEQIARSRAQVERDLRGLRYELDFPRKIRRSFQTQTLLWIGGAVAIGAVLTLLSRGKKKIYVDAKSGAKSSSKLLTVGFALGALRFASNLLKPMIVSFVEKKISGYPSSQRPGNGGARTPGAPRP